jgi:hypothetical protein
LGRREEGAMIRVRSIEDQVVPVLAELEQGLRITGRPTEEKDTGCMEVQAAV